MEKVLIRAESLTELARKTVEEYISNNKIVELDTSCLEEYKDKQAGIFVTIYRKGALRGCIGTIGPAQKNIIIETITNAISSCTKDPRFMPVNKNELNELKYSVNVLMPPEPINSKDLLDPQKYGVIVVGSFNRRGLLLPRIESITTIDEQIFYAKNKAGIESDEPVTLYRFESIEHKED